MARAAEFRKVKLITGETKMVGKRYIVGYCHCDAHKGHVTVTLYKKHECKKKNCDFLEVYTNYPYWENKRKREEAKESHKLCQKEKMREKEEKDRELNVHLAELKDEAELLIKKWEFPIEMTSIKMTAEKEYKIFYVSERRENDWFQYNKLATTMNGRHHATFSLTHVVLPDGRFATIDDWRAIKG